MANLPTFPTPTAINTRDRYVKAAPLPRPMRPAARAIAAMWRAVDALCAPIDNAIDALDAALDTLLGRLRKAFAAPAARYELLIPVADNHGQQFSADEIAWLENQLIATFGAFTMTGWVSGAWRNDAGKVYRDRSRRYVVITDKHAEITALASACASVYRQECIYLARQACTVAFVER